MAAAVECGAHQLARRHIQLTKDQQVCMIMPLYCGVSLEVAGLFALMSADPEGRLKKVETPKIWAPQIHLGGEGKNHRPVQPGSSQDLHATLYEFRGGPLEDDPSSMDPSFAL